MSLGGSDGSTLSGASVPGKVIGPSFAADEVADAVEAVIETYKAQRAANERFIDTVRRIGIEPFKAPGQCGAAQHSASPLSGGEPHAIHRHPQDRWHALGGEDGPPVSINAEPYLLLDTNQWHARARSGQRAYRSA